MNDSESGYDLGIFVTDPGLKFQCGVCLNILKDPHQCKNGHCFCLECFQIVLTKVCRCPICKTPAKVSTISRNLFVKDAIDELQTVCISCTNVPQNTSADCCKWVGSLVHRQNHYDSSCKFAPVACCFQGCMVKVPRKAFEQHTAECEHGASFRVVHNKLVAKQSSILLCVIAGGFLLFILVAAATVSVALALQQLDLQNLVAYAIEQSYTVVALTFNRMLTFAAIFENCVIFDVLVALFSYLGVLGVGASFRVVLNKLKRAAKQSSILFVVGFFLYILVAAATVRLFILAFSRPHVQNLIAYAIEQSYTVVELTFNRMLLQLKNV
jgi:hypothetical protein